MRLKPPAMPVVLLGVFSLVATACGGGGAPAAATQGAAVVPTVAAAAPTAIAAAPTVAAQVAPTAAAAPTTAPAAAGGKKLRVGLVTDVGKIDDKSFNQSAWEGVKKAGSDLGAEVKFIETTDPKDYGKNIDQFAQDNYDVIVTVG